MSMQDATERDRVKIPGAEPTNLLQAAGNAASDAAARLGDAAQAAGRQAKDAASDLAAEAGQNVKGLLKDQIAVGAGVAHHVADAVRVAADRLRPNAPLMAGFIGSAAGTIEDFSASVRDQSVEDLWHTASDFTRRQPAAVFGAAALAGFFLFRVLKAESLKNDTKIDTTNDARHDTNRDSDYGRPGGPRHDA